MKEARLPRRILLVCIGLLASSFTYAAVDVQNSSAREPTTVSAAASSSGVSDKAETGLAAVYSNRLHGRKTASGERYDRNALTAAHQTLPFGTRVKVVNQKTQKSVILRINDRGPTQAGRILDISPRAAKAIGMRPTAMAPVTAEVTSKPVRKNR